MCCCCDITLNHVSLVLFTTSGSDELMLFYFAYMLMIMNWYDSMIELRVSEYTEYTTTIYYLHVRHDSMMELRDL